MQGHAKVKYQVFVGKQQLEFDGGRFFCGVFVTSNMNGLYFGTLGMNGM